MITTKIQERLEEVPPRALGQSLVELLQKLKERRELESRERLVLANLRWRQVLEQLRAAQDSVDLTDTGPLQRQLFEQLRAAQDQAERTELQEQAEITIVVQELELGELAELLQIARPSTLANSSVSIPSMIQLWAFYISAASFFISLVGTGTAVFLSMRNDRREQQKYDWERQDRES